LSESERIAPQAEADQPARAGRGEADPALVEGIRTLLGESLGFAVPSVETDLIETGLLDSFGLVEVLFELERRFDVDVMVGELEIEHFRTVARIADFVAARRGEAP
jgi:methoxymalonate biosynthesis acyl carrier protein